MRTLARCLLASATSALVLSRAVAQAPTRPASDASAVGRIAVVVADGRVHLYPDRVPGDGEGWILRRDAVRLTSVPLSGVRGPNEFAAIVGPDLELVQRITGTESSLAAYRRLRAGTTASGIAQILSPRTAVALGALFVDSTAIANAQYIYEADLVRLARPDSVLRRVRAVVRVVPTVIPTPVAPVGRAADGVIALEWTPPRFTGAADDPVVAYVVERADSAGGFQRITAWPVMRRVEGPSGHTDEAAEPGRLYRYRIRAADLLGRLSPPSPVVAVRAPSDRGPMPPIAVATEVADGSIRVVWTIVPDVAARGYHVERSVGADSTFRRVTRTPVPLEAPEWTDTLVRGREIYAYRVRSIDADGLSGLPSNPATARGLDLRAPSAPLGLVATSLPGHRVRLTWRAPPDRDVEGYVVQRAERDTIFAKLYGEPRRPLAYTDSGYDGSTLEPGREYAWRVTAVDSSGNASPHAEVRLRIVDDEAPEPARSLRLHNALGRWVELTWTPSPTLDVARYVVERSEPGGTAVLIATLRGSDPLALRDSTVPKGRVSTWSVYAVDSAGNRAVALRDTLTFRDLTRPPAPRRVTAIRSAGATTVRWERVVSSDFRGYIVYRAERTDGARTRLTPTPITALEFIDRAGTSTSRYVVRAVDASGNESAESPVAVTVERQP